MRPQGDMNARVQPRSHATEVRGVLRAMIEATLTPRGLPWSHDAEFIRAAFEACGAAANSGASFAVGAESVSQNRLSSLLVYAFVGVYNFIPVDLHFCII